MKTYKKILKLNKTKLKKIIKESIDKTLGFKSIWVVYLRDSASRWYSTTRPFQCARGFFKDEVLYYMKKHKAFNKLTMEELVKHYKRGEVEMWIADFGKFFTSGEYIIMLDRLHVKKAIELGVLPPLDILPPGQGLGGESGPVRWDITDDNSINENTNIAMKENIQTKSPFDEMIEYAYEWLDYMYNEGVIDYNEESIMKFIKGEQKPNYQDWAKGMLSTLTGMGPKTVATLKKYIETGEGMSVEQAINAAINRFYKENSEYLEYLNDFSDTKQSIKLNESQLRQIIREALNEYRPYQKDGDVDYVGPDPDKDYISGFTPFNKRGKKVKSVSIDDEGNRVVHQYGVTDFSHGKGHLCAKVADTVKNMFYQNDKIEWTDAEKEYIDNIYTMILKFAEFTKQEGNKKRGYNGQE